MQKKFKFKSKKGKEKINFFRCADEITGNEIIAGAHTEIFSNKSLIVEGCLGVYEYNPDYIRLNVEKGSMILFGKNFDMSLLENNIINVKGSISSIEFCIKEGRK